MPTSMFVSTLDPREDNQSDECVIDPDIYASELQKRWPFADVYKSWGKFSVEWELKKSEDDIGGLGHLFSASCTAAIRGGRREDDLEFAIWHRTMVPDHYPVYFFDEGLCKVIEVTTEMTLSELREIYDETSSST